MMRHEIKIGATYLARVAGREIMVRVTGLSRYGGWNCINTTETPVRQCRIGAAIRFISAVKLRVKHVMAIDPSMAIAKRRVKHHPKAAAILKRMGPRAE